MANFFGEATSPRDILIHTRLYDIDFGSGRPRYVEAIMPQMDGLVQLMEAAPMGGSLNAGKKHWAADGVDVQLHLATDDEKATR